MSLPTRYRADSPGAAIAVRGARAGRRLRAALSRAWRAVADTVRPAGWLLAGVAVAGIGLGMPFGWREFVVAGLLAAALLAMSLFFLSGARAYEVALELDGDHVVAGGRIEGRITVRGAGRAVTLPARIDVPVGDGLVDVTVPLLRAGRVYEASFSVPAHRRGVVEVGPAHAVRGDPLGILAREARWDHVHEVYVHPRTTPLLSTNAGLLRDLEGRSSAAITDDDISFHALREYQPGDEQRQIHWKSTARSGQLMVRQYEETRRSSMLVVLALGADEYGADDEFELAVSAAASLGIRGLRDGRDLHVVVSGDVPAFARRSVRSIRSLPALTARTLLDALTAVERDDAINPMTDVAALAAESTSDVSVAFLVCGSTQTARTVQAAALAFPPQVAVVAVVCNPEAEPRLRRLGPISVVSIGLIDDLRQVLSRGAQS
ncbi:DUF58 domain-containing protein [Microbacterium sp. No. 7]|uniref:DUF58 domain-containing protein n=1 Tax=Microbacterium sp. No. 7 TaxID=1714373 RepID=UPI0006D2484E|nr:DUF58 domain-containing protein [Microbacterium sp. No. 7]ALJ19743.1 hypothetical protein AOA12_07425 [Microbacterium sp. No. 7]